MKKTLILVFGILFCISLLFAGSTSTNVQKIHSVDSDVYEAILYLYIAEGYALPSTAGPWSADELLKMLARVDRYKLNRGATATYEYVLKALEEDSKAVKFGLDIALEGYYHTDTENFTKEADWILGFNERRPLLDLVLETWPSEHFYGYSSLPIANNCFNGYTADEGIVSTFFGKNAFTSNLIILPPATLSDLDFNIPFRAFGAIGGEGWSLQIGRDKLSWGPGETGNFIVGDHLLYHNLGRLTTYGKNFKYTFATSFFPHPAEYYPIIDSTNGDFINKQGQDNVLTGLNMFVAHRLEWRLFANKVGIALTEAMMYQSLDNTLDLRILSPAIIYHNNYIRSNSNSIISFEVDYTPIKFLNLYGQMVVDEFALPGEPVPGDTRWESALPNGFGFMAGAKASYPLKNGMVYGSLEWAQTDPYLYLRDNGNRTQILGEYGINWVVALRQFSNGGSGGGAGVYYDEQFLGYEYGGDAIVLNANGGFKQFGKWYIEGNMFYMLHGTHDKWTLWSYVDSNPSGDTPNVETPTDTHYNENNGDLNEELRNAVSETLVIGVKGGYSILTNLDVFAQADYIRVVNPGNISTNPTITDVQLTFGVSYSL
ncbi:MAG: hypothetical protein CVV48_01065 [Spirochaetae bacterium HGW-Spirochaetae-4]|nr:MAG: hypothetical protein CVV48_01065 [Spirochaetae bacterium HGW-Spirochaetae-4]